MDITKVKQDIEQWLTEFVEVPHPALGNFAPCPYARSARVNNAYEVLLGCDPYYDLKNRARWGMQGKEVVIYVYDADVWSAEQISVSVDSANQSYLVSRDLLALEDHPQDPEVVNGVCMNQGKYALIIVQCLSDLNQRARALSQKGYYQNWPEDYLGTLFAYREDPRL